MERLTEQYITAHSSPPDPLLHELYRETHIRFINPNMASGYLQGLLLEMISKMINPSTILEIGTFTGYSAICLARGLKEGGKLVTIEMNDELEPFSRSYFERAGLSGMIIQMTGRAQEIIPGLTGQFDLVFIDGDKREYCDYFSLIKDKVKKEGFIIADNALWGGRVLETETTDQQTKGIIEFNEMIRKEDGFDNLILPFRDGLNIIRKS
jgi:caffeoyl-CoA O-methyltransferase